MEVKFENLKQQMAETIADVLKHDTVELQKEYLEDHASAIIVMCDTFHIITHAEAVELRNMALDARKRIDG